MVDIVNLLISLASGALGGNVAGGVSKENSLGVLGNSLAGIFGGGLGNALLQIFGVLGASATEPQSMMTILTNIATSGVSGAILPLLISFVKRTLLK